ncbi:MAG: N-acetylmuramoyl-L-alanine amidase [Lachnospiraceae bacterium]|nr:N-acetylmuramoyl-L-alanine amidase [Lachnospiraceae bacterium]
MRAVESIRKLQVLAAKDKKIIEKTLTAKILSNRIITKGIGLAMGIMLILSAFLLSQKAAELTWNSNVSREKRVVVIDAGHGGDDPGKIGVNQAEEKDINLRIANRVQKLLEQNDINVIMTRKDNDGLYDRSVSNKKVQDMKNRLQLIQETKPMLTVSIHQNSYHEESIHGAQVFYYDTSIQGGKAAKIMQEMLIQKVDPENHRVEKANTSYYLLKKTETPIIIVECGFLSNWKEAELLVSEAYQEKLAWAIHLAILSYINEQ